MSIHLQNQIDELRARVAALESVLICQQHKDDVQPVVPKELAGKTLTLSEKRKLG